MAGFDFGEGVRKAFLAGVGAIATGAEMSQELIDELVKKGEATMEQNKGFSDEMAEKASKAVSDAQDSILRAWLEGMTPEERAAYAQKVTDFSSDIKAKEAEKAAAEAAAAEAAQAEDAEPAEQADAEPAEDATQEQPATEDASADSADVADEADAADATEE